MAALAPHPHSFPANEDHLPPPADPFWQATPRITNTSQELELLMAAQQVVPPTPRIPQHRLHKFLPKAAPRGPTCTHTTMNRLYGNHTCHMCGKVPSIGWVYSCQQDHQLQYQQVTPSIEALPEIPDSSNYFEAQAKVAESIGMSKSVIKQMRSGEYTFDQIEILLQQRQHVLDVIHKSQHGLSHSTTPSLKSSPTQSQLPAENVIASVVATATTTSPETTTGHLPMSPAGTPANTPAASTATTPVKNANYSRPTCIHKVCHSCRPFLRDRLPMSFEPVLSNEVPAITETEIKRLPLLNPGVVRNLGLGEVADSSPRTPIKHTEVAIDQVDGPEEDVSSDWTPTSASSSAFDSDDSDDVPPARKATGGMAPRPQLPLKSSHSGLRHMRGSVTSTSEGTSSAGSSISLPDPKTEPLTPTSPDHSPFGHGLSAQLGKTQKAASVCGVMNDTDNQPSDTWSMSTNSSSSVGSEVDVDGGVALAGEGVGSGVPDIVTEK
ncbi:uncharacterized protein LTR77_007311 [Saxophila tyrrhenica]|uniref:Uncharacterized protein n=1 Tax=Saxophila tyrrhenica TaxID=1690608 RepID=A0AAV9P857_9PEZI|nr:hypothetical protein LTR77_007311 [Saxophila tyrrhenica]